MSTVGVNWNASSNTIDLPTLTVGYFLLNTPLGAILLISTRTYPSPYLNR